MHPSLHKTKLCSFHYGTGECPHATQPGGCNWAHSIQELKPMPEWCRATGDYPVEGKNWYPFHPIYSNLEIEKMMSNRCYAPNFFNDVSGAEAPKTQQDWASLLGDSRQLGAQRCKSQAPSAHMLEQASTTVAAGAIHAATANAHNTCPPAGLAGAVHGIASSYGPLPQTPPPPKATWLPTTVPEPEFAKSSMNSRKKAIRIFTFGLETLDAELRAYAQKLDREGVRRPDPRILREALRRKNINEIDILMDVRHFRNPPKGEERRHLGEHPGNLQRFVEHRKFEGWVRKLKNKLEVLGKVHRPVRVAFYCRSGRHRSVSAAWFLRKVGEHIESWGAHEGWQCMVSHLSQHTWDDKTCQGGSCCEVCRGPSTQSEWALKRALELWQA